MKLRSVLIFVASIIYGHASAHEGPPDMPSLPSGPQMPRPSPRQRDEHPPPIRARPHLEEVENQPQKEERRSPRENRPPRVQRSRLERRNRNRRRCQRKHFFLTVEKRVLLKINYC